MDVYCKDKQQLEALKSKYNSPEINFKLITESKYANEYKYLLQLGEDPTPLICFHPPRGGERCVIGETYIKKVLSLKKAQKT